MSCKWLEMHSEWDLVVSSEGYIKWCYACAGYSTMRVISISTVVGFVYALNSNENSSNYFPVCILEYWGKRKIEFGDKALTDKFSVTALFVS